MNKLIMYINKNNVEVKRHSKISEAYVFEVDKYRIVFSKDHIISVMYGGSFILDELTEHQVIDLLENKSSVLPDVY